ncbi:hypothetical protein BC940DRAFT_324088 [Gongronella butleri]|nr:hypothetical protein BC940DRAFT_324088 [Gongronella butleri]
MTHSPLLSRGFASLRRTHRHTLSNSDQRQTITVEQDDAASPMTPPVPSTASPPAPPHAIVNEHHIRLVPNVGLATRCFVFEVIERTLHSGVILKLGRYSDRNSSPDRLSFKSKVVSRCHAEIWQEDGRIYIKDSGSSSGTFVNRARLSPANTSSRPYTIQDGDLVQLGVDYKGGVQPMYRAVRMRFEVDRTAAVQQTAFSRAAFKQLKHCLRRSSLTTSKISASSNLSQHSPPEEGPSHTEPNLPRHTHLASSRSSSSASSVDIQECCICLYVMGPGQALFIAPCSHIFHYRCLRPILQQNFPGFSCPLCRTYSDLDATVAIEPVSEEEEEEIAVGDTDIDLPAMAAGASAASSSSAAHQHASFSPPGASSNASHPTPPPSTSSPSHHRRKSTDALLSTTLVGSPTAMELVHQHTSVDTSSMPSTSQ